MSQGLHIVSNGVSGFLVPDRKCVPFPAASRRTAVSSYLCHGDHKHYLHYDPRRVPVACNQSSNNRRRNPDFSRQQKGSSRGKSRQFQERENYDSLEEDLLASKNGPLLSLSGNQRGQATAKPGQREKEIVELFRKVQAQLRARAAIKEEKKMEAAQQGQGERGAVDSLLNLLRKHSIDQGGKNSEEDQDLDLDQEQEQEPEQNSNQREPLIRSRPASSFRRKSPVPRVRFQPIFTEEDDGTSISSFPSEAKPVIEEQDLSPEPFDRPDDSFAAVGSDTSDPDEAFGEAEESLAAESADLSSLKLSELRGIAKSRGMKGYSKLKKAELVELLIGLGA